VHGVAPCTGAGQQSLIRQQGESGRLRLGDFLSRLKLKASLKNSQLSKNCLLLDFELVPGLANDGAQVAVPFWHIAQLGAQEV
jgi:hypothetical protein